MSHTLSEAVLIAAVAYVFYILSERLQWGPLAKLPGPKIYALTAWRLAYDDWKGDRTRRIRSLHQSYGPVVRVGPSEVSFNSLSALRAIYGAGSGFERTSFYRMFDAYGKQAMFTFGPGHLHAERKKMLAHIFSKSMVIRGHTATLIQDKVRKYLALLAHEPDSISEIFKSLHFFSFDSISDFLYGKHGRTNALEQNSSDRNLISDILHHDRRYLSWFVVHFPQFTKWLYSQTGFLQRSLRPFLPMQPPTTYSAIRQHALQAWYKFCEHADELQAEPTLIHSLWKYHRSQGGSLDDLEIASECADNLLAGIDTTSDTLTFLIWALSLPKNAFYQAKLIEEVANIPESACDAAGIPSPEACGALPYLDAVIKETLRLYAPLPASEPRSYPTATTVDGYLLPERTVVSMSPYALHRNPDVFDNPAVFNPERWLGDSNKVTEMNRWFWAFSSGARMCTGMHFAMAQMTTLVAAVYRKYDTAIVPGFNGKTPAITSRFELFYDESYADIKEHECWIKFIDRSQR